MFNILELVICIKTKLFGGVHKHVVQARNTFVKQVSHCNCTVAIIQLIQHILGPVRCHLFGSIFVNLFSNLVCFLNNFLRQIVRRLCSNASFLLGHCHTYCIRIHCFFAKFLFTHLRFKSRFVHISIINIAASAITCRKTAFNIFISY